MQYSKYMKRGLKAILFVAILILLTILLDAAYEFDEGETERMLSDYSKKTDLDMIFTGNSVGNMVDADLYSQLSGENVFNMCTPSQGFEVSLKNITMASYQHPIDHIILFVTYDSLEKDYSKTIEHLYDRVVLSSEPLPERVNDIIEINNDKSFDTDIVFKEESINIWIPWTQEMLSDWGSISGNIKRRYSRIVSRNRLGSGIVRELDEVVYSKVPGTATKDDIALLKSDVESLNSLNISAGMVTADKITLIDQICIYCRNNNIKLSVIMPPHRSDYYDRYPDYKAYVETINTYLQEFVSKRGFMYYNAEEDPKLHEIIPDSYFLDYEHIDGVYGPEVTKYLKEKIEENNL